MKRLAELPLSHVIGSTMSRPSQTDDASAAQQDQPSSQSCGRSWVRDNLGLLICACGFAAGCVFWHYVGFWAVVHALVHSGGDAERAAAPHPQTTNRAVAANSTVGPATVGLLIVKLNPETCTSLILDRASGAMTHEPCAEEAMPLKSLRAARKDDRRIPMAEAKATARAGTTPIASAPAVASWSATVVTSPPR